MKTYQNNPSSFSIKAMWLLFAIAAVSFIFTLNIPHIGEEGVYTVSSFEMWYNKQYLYATLYGEAYGRPPFFNWLILLLAKIVGWSHMLLASRLITASATLGIGLMTAWLTQNIFHDKRLAVFSALTFLVSDVLLYHGWLAYADPLFGLCVFTAIACLWVASERGSFWLLPVAMLSLVAAFLTKSLTAYVFYFTAFIILLGLGKRRFLLHPISIALHLVVLCMPLLWTFFTNDPGKSRLLYDILNAALSGNGFKITKYLVKFITFPFEIFIRMLPVSAVAAYYYFWHKHEKPKIENKDAMRFLVLFVVISFVPYWFSLVHASRYVFPVYPFIAIWCSNIVYNVGAKAIRITIYWLIAVIIIKYISIFFWWKNYPGFYGCGGSDYIQVAKDIIKETNDFPLYTNHFLAVDSIIDTANIARYPRPPVIKASLVSPKEKDYFVLVKHAELDKFSSGQIVHEYSLGKGGKLYLLCYGTACP